MALIGMFLYNGSEVTTILGHSLLPVVCKHLLAHLETLTGGPSEQAAPRSADDLHAYVDPFELENIMLEFIQDGVNTC